MLTDAQLHTLWQDMNGSIWLLGTFLNSAPLWELYTALIGFIVVISLVVMLIINPQRMFGLFHRF